MKKKVIIFVTILFLIIIGISITLAYMYYSAVKSNNLPETPEITEQIDSLKIDSPVSFTNNTSYYILNSELYTKISKEFKTEKTSVCLSKLTNSIFKNLSLSYDSCKWEVEIKNQNGITLRAMAMYINNYIVFTNKTTYEQVQVYLYIPGVFEYFGPIAICYPTQSDITKLNETLYKYTHQTSYADGQVLEKIDYLPKSAVITPEDTTELNTLKNTSNEPPYTVSYAVPELQQSSNYCIKQGIPLITKAEYSNEIQQIFAKFNLSTNDSYYSNIFVQVSSKGNAVVTDKLISGFNF